MPDPIMDVKIFHEEQYALVDIPKRETVYQVYKPKDGTILFKIRPYLSGNVTPKPISGQYSSIQKAIEALAFWNRTIQESHKVKSDRLEKERKARHAAAAKSADS